MGRCYPHMSLEERREIAKCREAKMPVPEIADRLGRAPSTIYRELKRNFFDDKALPARKCRNRVPVGFRQRLKPGVPVRSK